MDEILRLWRSGDLTSGEAIHLLQQNGYWADALMRAIFGNRRSDTPTNFGLGLQPAKRSATGQSGITDRSDEEILKGYGIK